MMKEKKNYNLEDTPWYFGAYFNMARHNVFLLINHLTEKFAYLKFRPISNDRCINNNNILTEIFDPSKKIYEDERLKIYKYLVKRHYLPFIKIFHQSYGQQIDTDPIVEYERLHTFIKLSFSLLNEFRDSYSHYLAISEVGEIIEGRSRIIDEKLKADLLKLFELAPEFSLKRFELTQTDPAFKHLNSYKLFETNSSRLTEHGFYFFINLFLERSYASKFLKKISGFKDERIPAFKATLQSFTAYSLRVPDVRLANDDRKFSLLLEMLNELQRCPKELYNRISDEDKKKFEPTLMEEEKNNILLNSTHYDQIKDEDIDALLSEITTLKRNKNRFPYFALRCIDELELLSRIRFQITLGKLQVDNYPKKINQIEYNRRILKTINAFGKLSDFEKKEIDILKELKQGLEENEKVCFDQYAPHYNIKNNKIAFYLFDEKDEKIKLPDLLFDKNENEYVDHKPTGFISLHDLPKLVLLAYFKKDEVEKPIHSFIHKNNASILRKDPLDKIKSQLDLTPKEFTRRQVKQISKGKPIYLTKKKEESLLREHNLTKDKLIEFTNEEIKDKFKSKQKQEHINQIKYNFYLEKRRRGLQSFLQKGISVNQLPKRIYNYLLDINDMDEEKIIHQKIKSIHDDCKVRLKHVRKELKKEKTQQNLKLGEFATFLARDIIDLIIEEKVKQKITSIYYNKLQNKLAYFSISKHDIIDLCEELNLFDSKNGHVFLDRKLIVDADGIIEFYQEYLEEKKYWIKNKLFIKGKKGGYVIPETMPVPFLYRKMSDRNAKYDFTKWLENKSMMPIDLPNSLFDESIERELGTKLESENIEYLTTDKFSIRLSKLCNNDTQPFYKFKRVYKYNDDLKSFHVNNLSGKEIKLKYGAKAEANEKKIRFIQSQDRILKLLCEKILLENHLIKFNQDFVLNSLMPFSKRNPLNSPAKFQQKINLKNKQHFMIIAEDNQQQIIEIEAYGNLEKESEREAFKGQKGYEWTLKDFGKFKRMVSDRRISNLSNYFEDKDVTFDFLMYQLREYDKYREIVFCKTFEFEEKLTEKKFNTIKEYELLSRKELEDKGKPKEYNEVSFSVFTSLIQDENILNHIQSERIKKIRNAFSHSEFPDYHNDFTKITNQDIADFEKAKFEKDKVQQLDLSISKKIFLEYKNILDII